MKGELLKLETAKKLKQCDKILTEITNYCENCPLREKCIEKECVLFRIEKIVEGK